MAYGTLSIFDTIGARRAAANDYIGLYDPNTLYQQLQVFLDAHNALWSLMEQDLVDDTTDRFYTWGSYSEISMMDADELSRPDAQKITVNPTMNGFPLWLKQVGYGVDQLFMETKTLGDLEQVITACTDADIKDRLINLRKVLFNPTNNLTYKDKFVDGITLPLRALVNADGAYIPPNRWGVTFDSSTHTHYLGIAGGSVAESDVTALTTTVTEHFATGAIRIYINRADEGTYRAFTDFHPYWDVRLTPTITATQALDTQLDVLNIYNRAIGILNEAEVWVKPWVPVGYALAFNTMIDKPLCLRTRPTANISRGVLRIAAQTASYPLQGTVMEREYGIGVKNRLNGACLDMTHNSYQAPSAWVL